MHRPCAVPGLGCPLWDAQMLQEAVQEAPAHPWGPPLPPSRLQLGPVSFGYISLKRSPTPGFLKNT